ncbi:MAG: preprotein translocase subunit SecA, partial [Candidatus Omnitrophica bacterium]|nr:preprotein translocase subunit SecA [Candidatus Omnitrophota bacterium]
MLNWVVDKIIGSQNARELKQLAPAVERINALEPGLKELSMADLRAKSDELRKRLLARIAELGGGLTPQGTVPAEAQDAPKQGATGEGRAVSGPSDGIGHWEPDVVDEDALKRERKRRLKVEEQAMWEFLPEAFALVREVSRRTTGMRHFDVQMIGGMVLHKGRIAEMTTGEGKTLVATLPAYLNALLGRGVHIVTVNDYLARRDRNWMGPIYESLGLTVGVIQHGIPPAERRKSYHSDITYGTNNEFGFDYLRDNMAVSTEECVQRRLSYAIVDEVDSILIDEARTPLIISGPAEESTDLYYRIDRIVPKLEKDKDYTVDEKAHSASLTEEGVKKAEAFLGVENLFEDTNVTLVHHIQQALRAHSLYRRDVEYMIKDGQVVIVDEFTGRLMPGRRWSDGLHQAVEAKEGVKIERENQTLATITFQNYFRMFDKLAGMTGTASTEAAEFSQIYKLEVSTIPTNRPLIRTNHADVVYKTEREKFDAVVNEIAERHEKGQPVLVGTISIEKSERVSALLKRRQVPHHVLNARYHEMEAQIVAQAGRYGMVTIATNMAGRGTDIVLGGNPDFLAAAEIRRQSEEFAKQASAPSTGIGPSVPHEVVERIRAAMQAQTREEHDKVVAAGGLHVLGTERHESRRIDNQLRGRCGRQGDPGSSRFYLSLEDELIRLFGENKLLEWTKASIPEGEAIEHPWLTRAVETAQKRVEMHNFEIRKRLLEYDNVMNRQREVIYRERRSVLEGQPLKPKILEMLDETVAGVVELHAPAHQDPEEWNFKELADAFSQMFGASMPIDAKNWGREELLEKLSDLAVQAYDAREQELGPEQMRRIEHWVMLQVIDSKWKDHLYAMDHLREGIGYRVYGQQDPLVEYQHEAFQMFTRMVESVRAEVVELIFRIQPVRTEQTARVLTPTQFLHPEAPQAIPPPAPSPVGMGGIAEEAGQALFSGLQPRRRGQLNVGGEPAQPIKRDAPKVGRNDPCPCGSNKKYKKCHGA